MHDTLSLKHHAVKWAIQDIWGFKKRQYDNGRILTTTHSFDLRFCPPKLEYDGVLQVLKCVFCTLRVNASCINLAALASHDTNTLLAAANGSDYRTHYRGHVRF